MTEALQTMADTGHDIEDPLHRCEQCGKAIFTGDKVQRSGDGCAFCEEHAATMSDIIRYWEEDLKEDEDDAGWPEFFEGPEEVQEKIDDWKAEIAAKGDYKPMQVA